MRIPILCILTIAVLQSLHAQDLKAQAAKAIDSEDYAKAIGLLEQVVRHNPTDADAWYQLGHSLHWLCYDSTPLSGYNRAVSERILECMHKALTLDPHLRNCYSVIGSEYGARAEVALQTGDWANFIQELKNANEIGAFPEWLLEYARNLLNSCGLGAILFTGGDAEVFPIWYCQFIDSVRTDVTLVPVPLLDRTWFILLMK